MKQGAIISKIVIVLFFLAILLYFGGTAWHGLRDPFPTVQAYAFSLSDTVETTGWLARSEQVLTGNGGIVRLTPAEGEKVAAGATVALLYANETAMEQAQRVEELQAEEAQLSAAIASITEQSGAQGEKSSQVVLDALVKLRASVEGGDFTQLESRTASFKSAVYSQSQKAGDEDTLALALSNVRAEIDRLLAQSANSTGRITAFRSGIFSGQVDGYESVLLPSTLKGLTPEDLDRLSLPEAAVPVPANAVGKLIIDSTWYFVCPLDEAACARLTVGKTIPVRFSRDWSGTVNMKVESIGPLQGGVAAVVLSSDRYLSNITLLRRQTVELIFSTQTGIRVPTGAIRIEGEDTVVYVKVGAFAEKKTVSVLARGDDYYLVTPLLPKDATDAQRKKSLRAGDAVIITGEAIWDGKVLE